MVSDIISMINNKTVTICIAGIGYVGLSLINHLSKNFKVIAYDINIKKIKEQAQENNNRNITYTSDPKDIGSANIILACVPTPVREAKIPDLSSVMNVAKDIGKNMQKGCVVAYESTFYPGVTEEIIIPILEQESGYICGKDFKIGYSPERINPGDINHTIDKIVKIVSGMDEETLEILTKLYETITNVHKVKAIKTAEAAKIIENIQRDLNIALVNELTIIMHKMDIDIHEVLEAASTKWNFINFEPGLVGGHCIPVDPYYLVYKSQVLGYHPQVILAGRTINDYMPTYISEMTIRSMIKKDKIINNSKILIMGLTYKENVNDTRTSPSRVLIKELSKYGVRLFGYDPYLTDDEIRKFGIENYKKDLQHYFDCIIVAVKHDKFKDFTIDNLKEMMSDNPILIDVKRFYRKNDVEREGIFYKSL